MSAVLDHIGRAIGTVYDIENVGYHGIVGDGETDNTDRLLSQIEALRMFAEDRLDTIGGDTVEMYRSGTLRFGAGIFRVAADALDIRYDMGLTFKGAGSRRFTNAIRGRTTLLISGASSGWGIKFYRNGARSAFFEDIDICYEDDTFTGDLIDLLDSPGLKGFRSYFGTFGIAAADRKQSAKSLLRLTYAEEVVLEDCTLDGAVDGIWSDDTRTELANTFGGWGIDLNRVTFYDFTNRMLRHDGNRTLGNLSLRQAHFNPISVSPVRAIDVDNVDQFHIDCCNCVPSDTQAASTEWMRITNSTGLIEATEFGDLAKAGSISGNIEFTCNKLAGTDGIDLRGGIITIGPNEISTGTTGFRVADPPDFQLTIIMDPQRAKAGVGELIDLGPDTASVRGLVTHDPSQDQATTPFSNANTHITVTSLT